MAVSDGFDVPAMPTTRHHAVHSARRPEGVLLPGLTEYAKEPGFLRDTFRSLQDRYHARFAKFIEVLLIMSDKPSRQDMLTKRAMRRHLLLLR